MLTAVHKGLTSMRSIMHLEQMVNLRTLNLHMNQLMSLDRDIMLSSCMRNVTELDVSGNELETIDGIEHVVHLRRLNVASNRIRSLSSNDGWVRSLQWLEWVNFAFNLLEDILALRQLSGEMLAFVDISGNLLRRWEAVDALSHCANLRELRVTIARPSSPLLQASPRATTSAASPTREHVDEQSLQLLDNPLVATAGYQDHIRSLLPQLVLLDGVRVGFDPLQDPSSFGLHASARQTSIVSTPQHHHVASLSPQLLQQWEDDNTARRTVNMIPDATPPSAGARTKRISRSSQTTADVRVSLHSVAVETTEELYPRDDDKKTAGLLRELGELKSRLTQSATAAQEERSEFRTKLFKYQQLLSSVTAERDDARSTCRALEASAAQELNDHLQSHSHTTAQVVALKDQLQRAASDAERHEQIALKLQHERLTAASREHDDRKKQKWQAKMAALEREHQSAMAALSDELQSRAAASSSMLAESKDRVVAALQQEVELLKHQLAAHDAEHWRLEHQWRTRFQNALIAQEGSARGALASDADAQLSSSRMALVAERHRLYEETVRREWGQLLSAYHAASAAAQRPAKVTAEAVVGTPPVYMAPVAVQTEPIAPEPCPRCPALARRIVEIETATEALEHTHNRDAARLTELAAVVEEQQQMHRVDVEALQGEASALHRTLNNLKASLAAQEESHQREVEEIMSECRTKIDEKRLRIADLEASIEDMKKELSIERRRKEDDMRREQEDCERERIQRSERGHAELRTLAEQNRQLLDAVRTLRQQLIAVDTVNRSLSARTEDCVRQQRKADAEVQRLHSVVHSLSMERDAAEAERERIRGQLKSLIA